MINYKVRSQVKQFIREYSEYISKDGEQRALDFLDYLEHRFDQLSRYPLIGRAIDHIKKGIRVWPNKKYRIYIYYKPEKDIILIERILSMHRENKW